jgi:hypothetical protein
MNEAWAEKVEQRIARLEQFQAVEANHRINVERRLGGIESSIKWLAQLIVGALILAIIGFALRGGFAV